MMNRLGRGIVTCAALLCVLVVGPAAARKEVAPPDEPGRLPEPMRQITVPIHRPGLAKFEPEKGCFLGAFVANEHHLEGSMARWEETTGKGHASYLLYVGYGQPFPSAWVEQVRDLGAVPNIAWEPNQGLDQVQDDAYLRQWARDAAMSGGPVFLRFASEMNGPWTKYHGDPAKYKEKFGLIARAMRKDARNVAMVWTPYCTPASTALTYYPGDWAVDWVGVNIYSVHHHNGKADSPADHEDPNEFLQFFYDRFAKQKPIQISEYASTHYCLACETTTEEFAIAKMERLYATLRQRFPRVKGIYWFSWDTIKGGAAENNYSLIENPRKLDTYRRLIRSEHFLPRLPEGELFLRRPAPEPTD